MAETLLSPVIEKLIDLLIEEAKSVKGVEKQVKSLQKELEMIEPLLRDAEAKSGRGELSDASKVWLKQLREEAQHIEDVVDEFTYCAEKRRYDRLGFAKALKTRRDLGHEIREIEESLRKIKERGLSYGLRPFEQGGSSGGEGNARVHVDIARMGSLFVNDDELVGIESISEELVRSFVEGTSNRTVISLVGEGGIGKTTLARKVYNDVAEKGRFHHRVWVTVSQSFDIHKILKTLTDQICPRAGKEIVAVEDAVALLRSSLKAKRYVIVFDDVWQIDFWSAVEHAFPSDSDSCGIIVTTRNSSVVESFHSPLSEMIVKELKTWPREQAWELFCKKAFSISDCPPHLERLSLEILSKCQGLPLAIVVIAGLLSKKNKCEAVWQGVLDNLNKNSAENRELSRVSKILLLSYHDLPYHLKPCFLYFGVFPEDFLVHGENICQLWIAEGFIKSREDETLEQMAEDYLIELINRNLVSSRFEFGSDRWCKVHDLIRDVILTKTSELGFCQIFHQNKSNYTENIRRLIVYDATKIVWRKVDDSKIRSVAIFSADDVTNLAVCLFRHCKLLKVLNFEGALLYSLPKEVRNLFHLKYLNLKYTNVEFLPKSIGNLHNLQLLDVSRTSVRELPIEINKLRKLRHLIANNLENGIEYSVYTYLGVRIQKGIGALEDLQTLTRVEAQVEFIRELPQLRRLQCLGISSVTTEMGKALGESIERMKSLEKLLLSSISQEEVLDLRSVLSPPPLLRYLRLSCRLNVIPDWISMLHNLQGLELNFSRTIDEPLRCCKALPNLAYLRLYEAYEGEELRFEEGSFQKLKELHLRKLKRLKAVKIERGALPNLEQLHIGPFPMMKEMPWDFQYLTSLKSLNINDMPREFLSTLKPDGSSDYSKIQHVPFVMSCWYGGIGVI